ncbi:citrate synthase [Aquirufa aurantiipilula]|uniref:Citrate synthase n=1 Tax=Aquirufa aurantiipilula TaxID=2696561 RepID=A0ABT6BI77_9BACT|nr:citrate synthase [Aquirufa aurantiipilula]MBZ1325186.1 citrate synthase [Aquirufa aurantiipilula]MDF5690025.1 citrate synthase [Aquirufa aurantiipilula]
MSQPATINLEGKSFDLPTLEGTENEKAIDIAKLRDLTGYITFDPGFKNTGVTKSSITYLDGEDGILRYRGYSIEELADKASFLEVAYLLIHEELPTQDQLDAFSADIQSYTQVNQDLLKISDGFPVSSHPMCTIAALVGAMSAFYSTDEAGDDEKSVLRLLAQLPVMATWSYKKSIGEGIVQPDTTVDYCSTFLQMMFAKPGEIYTADAVVSKALNKLLILHADHEQNCSTSTVRLVGSSHANLFASISAGINALWGPLHGGANQEVIEMLEAIKADGGDTDKYIAMAKDKNSGFRLMGFGHRVYKNFDPRAKIIKKAADDVLKALGVNDPVLAIAARLEAAALSDEYFVARKLYPNVDFYSGIIYRALGIPTNMFTVMFAIGRLPGWIAQWKEMRTNKEPIGRPRQIYTGATSRAFVEIAQR